MVFFMNATPLLEPSLEFQAGLAEGHAARVQRESYQFPPLSMKPAAQAAQ
jgi:hypothetical protein